MPCPCCSGSSPETGVCASMCAENYSAIHAAISVGGSTGGHFLANPASAIGFTPNEAVFPAVSATLVFDRYGTTGLSQTLFTGSGVLSSSSSYSCAYEYALTRVPQTGRFCSIRISVFSQALFFDNGTTERSTTEHTFSFSTGSLVYYKVSLRWSGLPVVGNTSAGKILEYTLSTTSGVVVNCGSQFPTKQTATAGTGPTIAGLSYGDGGIFTTSSSPLIQWGSSYYRRVPQPEIKFTFV